VASEVHKEKMHRSCELVYMWR